MFAALLTVLVLGLVMFVLGIVGIGLLLSVFKLAAVASIAKLVLRAAAGVGLICASGGIGLLLLFAVNAAIGKPRQLRAPALPAAQAETTRRLKGRHPEEGDMTDLDRRHVLTGLAATGLGASSIAPSAAFAAPSPDDIGRRLAEAERSGRVGGLHALLISRGGRLVFEHYGKGDDESEIKGELHDVAFAADVPHDLRSVSKSVVGLTYGIALAEGKVPPPEARLYDQFPEYADIARQAGRDRITIHHVLSMTLGLDWDELTVPYGSDLRNSEIAMEAAPDRFRFILERPIVSEPGKNWTYCGGATALLGHLISKGTGEGFCLIAVACCSIPWGLVPSTGRRGGATASIARPPACVYCRATS